MRLGWMDDLRGAAIVAVVAFHAELVVADLTGATLPAVHAANAALEPVRMPLLVLLSGMLLPRSLAKGPGRHVRGKLAALGWPYLVWAFLDTAHVLVDAAVSGAAVPWSLVPRLFYAPQSYLWFLACLLVFHLAVTPMGAATRTFAVPLVLLLARATDELPVAHLVDLFGWFLVGDLVRRATTGRVPAWLRRAGAGGLPVLAAIGRQSIVYYACHLLVMLYAGRVLVALGYDHPRTLFAVLVVVPLLAGRALVEARHHPGVAALFAWPGAAFGRPAPMREGGARRTTIRA